jgi:Peptidase family M28
MTNDVKRRNASSSFPRFVRAASLLCIAGVFIGAQQTPQQLVIAPDIRAAIDHVSADSLRGHLSFIASDALEGRNTPSRGLDIAAEYIAAQFRRAGLDPAGDDGYFQTANWLLAERNMDAFKLEVHTGSETITVSKAQISLSMETGLNLKRAAVVKVDFKDATSLGALKPGEVEGKAVITEIPDFRREDRSRWSEMIRAQNEFMSKMSELKAAIVISVDRRSASGSGAPSRLIDPENRRPATVAPGVPLITVHDPRLVTLNDAMKPGLGSAELSIQLDASAEKPIKLRNVIGLLRGSDAALKDTYVLVTAHYDHVGVRQGMEGDNIFNGANDDGSGTVSVIELASALSTLKPSPKRSIVFMTFFGEEKGLLGSRFYGRHPVFPIDKTVADINLEQVGRTDSSEGPQLANAALTGFDYSEVGTILEAAGNLTGIKVYKHEQNSDAFFSRSDNQALADQGVPAHTLCTAFVYPDYHGVGDHWDKIDYANMEKVDRMVGLGLIMIANNPEAPKWNQTNPKTARYVKAWNDHHGK